VEELQPFKNTETVAERGLPEADPSLGGNKKVIQRKVNNKLKTEMFLFF
jgi:hypothetical protein